jgi:hypothetical protein
MFASSRNEHEFLFVALKTLTLRLHCDRFHVRHDSASIEEQDSWVFESHRHKPWSQQHGNRKVRTGLKMGLN